MSNILSSYQVFARKYRPRTLEDIKGQPILVRILTNALTNGRLGHAFIFHGIRGTGKTTTARVLARCLNCSQAEAPTLTPCGVCENCKAIESDRHIDVIEMDAASRTGVDDIREIIDSSRFKPVLGRYKIFIIDEVHMLSKSAFNALLKTLEEPPAHVKFLFATTEVQKIPATILSRCMRFDLQRFREDDLIGLFANVCEKESITTDSTALRLIAQAAEGSARDGLSILDQVANTTNNSFGAQEVQHMLGLASHQHIADLAFHLMKGEIAISLEKLDNHYEKGVNLLSLFRHLMEFIHILTTAKAAGDKYITYWIHEKDLQQQALKVLPHVTIDGLNRFWDIVRTSYDDIARALLPLAAARMAFIRLCYVANLPTPRELASREFAPEEDTREHTPQPSPIPLTSQAEPLAKEKTRTSPSLQKADERYPENKPMAANTSIFDRVCAHVSEAREPLIHSHLLHHVRCLDAGPGKLVLAVDPTVPKDFVKRLQAILAPLGTPWDITLQPQTEDMQKDFPTTAERNAHDHGKKLKKAEEYPLVTQALEIFPGAAVVDVKPTP
ncbi:MAG: DNA polymerase III subunit gamma/tau [Alphaproteobacteria bacterium]|nr:MAG: DNA polymerase III subunit gamma/tau [Alphaproteobacteria bacterium]